MGSKRNLLIAMPGFIFVGFIMVYHVYAGQWDAIPEKYSIKTLQQLYDASKIDTIFERCSQGVKEKDIPDEYKSILYTARAKTYLQKEGGGKKEDVIKAGLDCIRANHLDPKNYSCMEEVGSHISLAAMKLMEEKLRAVEKNNATQEDFNQIGKEVLKKKSDFIAELKQTAKAEKIEGMDAFFANMPEM